MKKVAIIVDTFDSGLGIAARGRAELSEGIEVIPALKFPSLASLMRKLEGGNYSELLFSWRYLLEEIHSDVFSSKSLFRISSSSRVGALIPDYQGFNIHTSQLTLREIRLLEKVDYYHVTNLDLAEKYQKAYPIGRFAGVLHDVPSKKQISSLRNKAVKKKNQVIWIGNSKWGSRSGYKDYKGYERVLRPIIMKSHSVSLGYNFEIVDLAVKRIPYVDVLTKIAESEILLVTSDFEGTGLPILEAIGLGTYVITTNVGIAPEIITSQDVGCIVEQDSEFFLREILRYRSAEANVIQYELFTQYVAGVKSEQINPNRLKSNQWPLDVISKNHWLKIKWLLRYFYNL